MLPHIADLHCDLLFYLRVDPSRSPFNDDSRCSIPQLRKGNVKLQTLAIFTETQQGSSAQGMEQAEIFKTLAGKYPDEFQPVQSPQQLLGLLEGSRIGIISAIENASSFCEEEGLLSDGLENLRTLFGKVGRPLYISLTWNTENRFGGGAKTQKGLKEDGARLLEFLDGKQIAVDLSHASDLLAVDILSYMDAKNLHIPLVASHSNVRSVTEVWRNLPDELIKEVIRRGGVIGLNFVRPFLGEDPVRGFIRHVEAFMKLGAVNQICFGADFFCDDDVVTLRPGSKSYSDSDEWFFQDYANASCYGRLLDLLKSELDLSEEALIKLAYGNLFQYIHNVWKELQAPATPELQLSSSG